MVFGKNVRTRTARRSPGKRGLRPRGPGGAVPVGARGRGRRKAAGCGVVGWMDRGETVVGPGWIWEDPKVGGEWVDGWRRGQD